MKKYLYNLFFIVLIFASGYLLFNSFKFSENSVIKNNNNLFPDRRTCGTVENYEMMSKKYPEYKKNREEIERFTEEYIKTHTLDNKTVITIPVVVHVVYGSSSQNISDDQILSQIDALNEDYRRLNSDTVNTPGPFKPLGADIQIMFCMARRDQGNNPTLGITRTFTNVQSFNTNNAVKFTASGGIDGWDRNKYLNIWVCNLGDNLLGYAEYPGGSSATDGVVILYSAFGRVGIVNPPYNKGRTATHEVGHWLNLVHIWGDDGGSCAGSDFCADTPNQAGENYGCPGFPHLDACSPSSPGVMTVNYMDYTDDGCMNIFTMNQSQRMNAVMSGPRAPLQTSTGCTNVSGFPMTSFTADSVSILFGGSVHFYDNSAGIPTGWNWTFTGGNPPTSTAQNPTVSYSTPGYYTVKLRISNSFGSDSLTKVNYVKVRGVNMNAFSILSPPQFTRIVTSVTDPSLQDFIWTKSAPGFVNYKIKFRKLSTSFDYIYPSNSSGSDTVISLRKSFLDTLAQTMGTTGDSVRCTWRTWAYNGIDSMVSSNSFIVSFVRNPIGIQQISSNLPSKFALYNNYPNPFNPATIIKFDVAKVQVVKITVYDLLGREVAALVNGELQPGSYSVDWNASNFASGIYYYRMESETFSDVKKMILVK